MLDVELVLVLTLAIADIDLISTLMIGKSIKFPFRSGNLSNAFRHGNRGR
jgi:hypothetical protein